MTRFANGRPSTVIADETVLVIIARTDGKAHTVQAFGVGRLLDKGRADRVQRVWMPVLALNRDRH